MHRSTSPFSPVSFAALGGLFFVVAGMTAAQTAGVVGLREVGASPARIASGKVWLLVTSGLLVQKPLALSMLSFAALGLLTLWLCGQRVLAWSALLGHVGSTLLAYAALALVRGLSPETFRGVWTAPDYGVSAIASAWLGAIACVCWRRRGATLVGKTPVVISCLAVAAFAWMVRRHLNVLDSEHVLAFAIGAVLSRRLAEPRATLAPRLFAQPQLRRFALVTAAVLVALVGASLADAVRSLEGPEFPAARLAVVGRRLAEALGDPHVKSMSVITTHERARASLSGWRVSTSGTVKANGLVYLLVLRGHFRCTVCLQPAPPDKLRWTVATVLWSTERGTVAWRLESERSRYSGRAERGRTVSLRP